MEKRTKTGKLTIRTSQENADKINNIRKERGITLDELLVTPILCEKTLKTPSIKLDILSKHCTIIEEQLTIEEDKKIFREGMKSIWEILLKI